MSRWYRAYEGTVSDAKLGEVALVAECSRSVAIAAWHCILESAASANDSGRFDTTPRRVAVILGEQPSLIETVFAELQSLGMIENSTLTAWSRRQYESDSSTERSRKHRNGKRNGGATLQEQQATPPETDTKTEKEEAVASSKRERDGEFDEFWAVYPKKDGKPEARKKFDTALKSADFPTILAGVKRYAFEREGEDKQYTMNPARWLLGQHWLDEPKQPPRPRQTAPPLETVGSLSRRQLFEGGQNAPDNSPGRMDQGDGGRLEEGSRSPRSFAITGNILGRV